MNLAAYTLHRDGGVFQSDGTIPNCIHLSASEHTRNLARVVRGPETANIVTPTASVCEVDFGRIR